MNRPRLFLSAVTSELCTSREAVAATLAVLGYDVVVEDQFPTGYGELWQWLREQIDSCEGLVQLVGKAYGTERPQSDPDHGRVSYTQAEFDYARSKGKRTWVFIVGDGCTRDMPLGQLDLPGEPSHPDPAGYQAERRKLQEAYVARIRQQNHLWHDVGNDLQLQNVVLRLRDDLKELREGFEKQHRDLLSKVDRVRESIERVESAALQAAVVTIARIRAHLQQTAEETHQRELGAAEAVADWKKRQQLRDAATVAHHGRLARIDELATSFDEIEGRGTTTTVFHEMTRILAEQGVDEAVAYVESQRSSILDAVKARASAAHQRNRADLTPLLKSAGLYGARGDTDDAHRLYRDILSAEPDWPDALHETFWFHADQGDIAQIRNTLGAARSEYDEADRLAKRLTTIDPGNTEWQRDLSVSHNKLGNLAQAQGDLAAAARYYGDGLEIAKTLAAKDPGNTEWQRDLAISYEKLGNLAQAQGDLAAAARYYGEDLEITKTPAAKDPGNAEWQRDLSISYEKLGNLAQARGDLDAAARYYGDGLDIRQTLAEKDLGNTKWQRDLSISYENLGNLAQAQGDLEAAARYYGEGLEITKTLAAKDPGNAEWQRDLLVSFYRLSGLATQQQQPDEALVNAKAALEIAEELVRLHPTNATFQRDIKIVRSLIDKLQQKPPPGGP
ncbi:MAG: tetratricopeptide repeat protein [Planctomycetales bacterium]